MYLPELLEFVEYIEVLWLLSVTDTSVVESSWLIMDGEWDILGVRSITSSSSSSSSKSLYSSSSGCGDDFSFNLFPKFEKRMSEQLIARLVSPLKFDWLSVSSWKLAYRASERQTWHVAM